MSSCDCAIARSSLVISGSRRTSLRRLISLRTCSKCQSVSTFDSCALVSLSIASFRSSLPLDLTRSPEARRLPVESCRAAPTEERGPSERAHSCSSRHPGFLIFGLISSSVCSRHRGRLIPDDRGLIFDPSQIVVREDLRSFAGRFLLGPSLAGCIPQGVGL